MACKPTALQQRANIVAYTRLANVNMKNEIDASYMQNARHFFLFC